MNRVGRYFSERRFNGSYGFGQIGYFPLLLHQAIFQRFYQVYTLGCSFTERVYHNAMIVELVRGGLSVEVLITVLTLWKTQFHFRVRVSSFRHGLFTLPLGY